MNYFNYAIKCVIRNIIYKLMKPKVFIPILFGILCTFLLANFSTVFGWEGDNTYTDKNSTIIMQYDSINQDLVNRIKYFSGNSDNIDSLKSYLKNNNYNYYLFYGSPNGSSMISGSYYATNDLYIYFYDRENFSSIGTAYDLYQGMTTNIQTIQSGLGPAFVFTGNNISTWTIQSFYIPTVLINYKSSVLYGFINDNSSSETNSIVGAINQQTNTINQQTQVIQETQDFLTDDTVDNSSMAIDTTGMSVDETSIDNFFTNFLNTVQSAFTGFSGDVVTITFGIPFTNQSIVLRSDVISSHLAGTMFETLITGFWWFLFSRYMIIFIKRMLDWLSTGKMAEEGVFSFIEWLDIHNEIINSYMM